MKTFPSGRSASAPPAAPPLRPPAPPRQRWRRPLGLSALGVIGLFLVLQAVPYGRSHTNPPVTAEPAWDSPATRALAARACFDCHSNQTRWAWYTNVAPFSWLAQGDVDGGRASLNFSEWNRPQDGAGDVSGAIMGGGMPPWFYRLFHPTSRLDSNEKRALVDGLQRTFAKSPPRPGGG